ncbi:MAG: DMT family transporter [Alcanivoracaceae bacterium]|jgi:drug/metabolite transporter (DMT)-like permease|nr:DMT family transporter [Alcanivoracaceae bacterium]
MQTDRHNLALGVSYALATSLVASTAAACAKYLSNSLSPWLIVWCQYGLCTLLTLPWVLRLGPSGLRTARPGLHLVRSLGGWLGFTTYYLALPSIALADASVLRSAAPLWVPLVVFVWLREKVPALRWVALLCGFFGVLLVLTPEAGGINPGHLLGMFAGIGLAISMATTRALSVSEPAARVLFYYFFISFIAATPMGLIHLDDIPPTLWPGLVYVGLSIFITMVLYNRAYTHAPTSIVAPLGYIAVPAAAVIDWLIWDHLPDAMMLAGCTLIILSGIFAVTLRGSSRGDH